MILCKDVHALLHVISLVDWSKHVQFFFFFFTCVAEICLGWLVWQLLGRQGVRGLVVM